MTEKEYQYRALHEAAALVDRSSRGRIRLTGADRRTYLQGLLTNDIAALAPGRGCYAAYLTPQGRMIADMRVFETGDELLVDLDASRAAAVGERWAQFVFTEDVRVEDISPQTVQVGIYGPDAAQVVARAWPFASIDQLQGMHLHDIRIAHGPAGRTAIVRGDDVGVAGFDVISGSEQDLRASLPADLVTADPDVVEACRIEAARPLFGVDMDEDTIPLEAGIEGRAISFTKGCYVGQEIVIRVLHRGHGRVARKLVQLVFDQGAPVPARGATLHAAGREVGSVTSAASSLAQHRPIALGYVHRDFAEEGTIVECRTGDVVTRARVRSA